VQPVGWIVLASVLGFALIWVGTIWGIARIGSWHLLADHYRARLEPRGTKLTWQSAMIGGARYKGSLVYVLAREGLYIATMPLFGFGHAPLLIPWPALADATRGTETGLKPVPAVHFYEVQLPTGRRQTRLRLPVGIIEQAHRDELLAP
jgi:hypothetical protein